MRIELVSLPALLCGSVLLIVLAVAVGLLIHKSRVRSAQRALELTSHGRFPFPQRAAGLEQADGIPCLTNASECESTVVLAYQAWLQSYILPDVEAGRSFLKAGVEKNWMRYQVAATSFGQGLALLVSLLMEGSGSGSQSLFDRLLAFCLAHPSVDSPELMSWLTLPDVPAYKRLDADHHAEAWIACALAAAKRQWGASKRLHYERILAERLPALLRLHQQRQRDDHTAGIFSPSFFNIFQAAMPDEGWRELDLALEAGARAILREPGARLSGDGSVVEARLGLLLLQLGMDELLRGKTDREWWMERLLRIARRDIGLLEEKISTGESAEAVATGAFSPLALASCLAPAVAAARDEALATRLWKLLSGVKPAQSDPLGATLRLLGLIALSGNLWLPVAEEDSPAR